MAKSKIELLFSKINITSTDEDVVLAAVQNREVLDFEDGLEYYSALGAGCQYIISEDVEDFYFSELPVVGSEQFVTELFKR